jgi:hypothetical protein
MEDIAAASRAAYQKPLTESGDFLAYPCGDADRRSSDRQQARAGEHVGVQAGETRWRNGFADAERRLLPSWHGGHRFSAHELPASAAAPDARQWHFRRVGVDAGTALAKADLDIMALYLRLGRAARVVLPRFAPSIRAALSRCCAELR